jgi:transcriptional regulator with GAF, ATPase, and Fis domain
MDDGGKIRYYDGTIEDITDRKLAEQALINSEEAARRLSQENELIAEIGRIISSTVDIEEVYERFAEKVREIIPFDRIAVNTISMKDYTRTIRYVSGDIFSGNKVGAVLALAGSGTEQVVRTKSSLLINSKNRDEIIRQYHGSSSLKFGAQSMMLIPLIYQDDVFGALFVYSAKIDAYTETDLLLAEKVGSQIAGAIANAQLFLERKQAEMALEEERRLLQQALDEVRTLRGIVPICAHCKKIRDDRGFWNQVEQYVSEHTEAKFSHGICPACLEEEMRNIDT